MANGSLNSGASGDVALVVGTGPAISMNQTYIMNASAISMVMENAAVAQKNAQIITGTAVGISVATILAQAAQ